MSNMHIKQLHIIVAIISFMTVSWAFQIHPKLSSTHIQQQLRTIHDSHYYGTKATTTTQTLNKIYQPISSSSSKSKVIMMGIFDSFFKERQNDFVKLESTDDSFGPGPIILFYNIPEGISNDELSDMIADGSPLASSKQRDGGVVFKRWTKYDYDLDDERLKMNMNDLLNSILSTKQQQQQQQPNASNEDTNNKSSPKEFTGVPILYFSGISNKEMMNTYRIIAQEIYDETEGVANAACAKAVKPAMNKSFRQLIDEISGDHLSALSSSSEISN